MKLIAVILYTVYAELPDLIVYYSRTIFNSLKCSYLIYSASLFLLGIILRSKQY